jgi:hypothetical protein
MLLSQPDRHYDLYGAENTEVVAVQYVQIAVSDTGAGMVPACLG